MRHKYFFSIFLLLISFSNNVLADIDNKGILDKVLEKYKAVASSWQDVLLNNALWLFWCLVLISMVFTFVIMLLKNSDISELFTELVRFMIFTGFYLWLLKNAPQIGSSIIKSLSKLAANAAGITETPSPSSVVDIGFSIFAKVLDQGSMWSPIDSALGVVIGLVILTVIALVAINMLILLITSWVLLYAGIFLLGFGGCKWTSDIAINYYKTVLGISIQIFTMILLIGIGKTFVDDYYQSMSDSIDFAELSVMLIVSIVLLYLTNKLPSLMSGIITGASVGGMGVGNFTAGALVGAAATAATGMSMAGKAFSSGAANIGGGGKAIIEAFNGASGSDDSDNFDAPLGSGGSGDNFDGSLSSAMGSSDESESSSSSAFSSDESESSSSGSFSSNGSESSSSGSSSSNGSESSSSGSSSSNESESSSSGSSSSNESESSSSGSSSSNESESSSSGSSSSDESESSSLGSKLTSGVKNLMAGASGLIEETFNAKKEAFNEKVDNTFGGKIAKQIKKNRENKK
ncbi:P-type conjugative transfer protein TrbL [Gilliamella sp. HK2]|jgi:type IV secretion system protein TrbL|uniref:P-type conjugative transfer protein TrbL n=1 Tax=unclassified Gilliamella TaxID=2685620 RepID=UPI00080EB939|nr:P-type conjugative transfer protein TrbL [Gilliamella apicola]OCG28978.1 P-type conjugative transfer protein TrbL [Gilliamella apicola]OCG31457.1 P-type conjugative transfer protein TrbL [Gilliamella apicola]